MAEIINDEKFIINFFKIRRYLINNYDFRNNPDAINEFKDSTAKIEKDIKDLLHKNSPINDYVFSDAAVKSISKFIEAEMDFYTAGSRGIGRMTSFIPRFGGYFIKFLKKLSKKEIEIIKSTIKDILNLGYYNGVYIEHYNNKNLKKSKVFFDDLFEKWIPKIYIENLDNNSDLNKLIMELHYESYLYFCIKLKEETEFPQKYLQPKIEAFGKGKLPLILGKYIHAGFILRYLEVNKYVN